MSNSRRSFGQDFKLFFLRGLVVLLPTILTLWILVKAFQFVHQTIAEPINSSVQWVMLQATPHVNALKQFRPDPAAVDAELRAFVAQQPGKTPPTETIVATRLTRENIEDWWDNWPYNLLDLFGILVAIVVIYFAGRLFGGFFGKRVYRRIESGFMSLPVVKQVYPYVKQIVDFIFGEDKPIEFKRVVLVEYPRRGIWSVGLLTGSAMKTVSRTANSDSVTIFIPSSPTPFTGYTITVPRSEAIDLTISVDEALRFVISGGVLMPERETLPPGVDPLKIEQPTSPLGLEPDAPPPSLESSGQPRNDRTEGDKT